MWLKIPQGTLHLSYNGSLVVLTSYISRGHLVPFTVEKQLVDDTIRSHDVNNELFINFLLMLYFVTIKILIPIFHTPLPILPTYFTTTCTRFASYETIYNDTECFYGTMEVVAGLVYPWLSLPCSRVQAPKTEELEEKARACRQRELPSYDRR